MIPKILIITLIAVSCLILVGFVAAQDDGDEPTTGNDALREMLTQAVIFKKHMKRVKLED